MASMILLAVLAILAILCLLLIIRMILGQTKTTAEPIEQMATTFSRAMAELQRSQTSQLGEVLDRHSSDLRQILNAQNDYISRFLVGPTIPPDTSFPDQPDQPNETDLDPGNWTLEDQLDHLPKQIRESIERENWEQSEIDRLMQPSHNIHTDPRIPSIVPGHSSAEQGNGNGWVPASQSGLTPPNRGV